VRVFLIDRHGDSIVSVCVHHRPHAHRHRKVVAVNLLGHRKVQTTARYALLARDSVRASTTKVAESIGADILPE